MTKVANAVEERNELSPIVKDVCRVQELPILDGRMRAWPKALN